MNVTPNIDILHGTNKRWNKILQAMIKFATRFAKNDFVQDYEYKQE